MFSLGLWSEFDDFEMIKLPKHTGVKCVGLSTDWVIASSTDQDLLIFRDPFIALPKPIPFQETVSEISCNQNMALLLTCQGCIWLIGEDVEKSNLFAEEGLYKSDIPIKVQSLSQNFAVSSSLSTHHAAMVSAEGFLYTWGKGENGELGNKRLKACKPTRIENGSIFKSRQVICIENHTAIVTQGGFLYIYGKSRSCHCGNISGYPFTVPELEDHFIKKAHASAFGIAVVTENYKCFIVKGCHCITGLWASHKIDSIATCAAGICGWARDKKIIYTWEPQNDWRPGKFKIMHCELENMVSGFGKGILLAADNFHKFPLIKYTGGHSPESSPFVGHDNDRTSFEQLFGSYDFGITINKETVRKEEACKTFGLMLSRCLAEPFRKIKEFSYLKWVYKRAYASTFTPNILGKIIKRINIFDKGFAFSSIKHYAKNSPQPLFSKSPVKILQKLANTKLRKIFLNLIKQTYKALYYKLIGKFTDRLILRNRLNTYFEQLIPLLKYIKNKANPFKLALKIVERQNSSKLLTSFQLWNAVASRFSRKNMLNSEKLNSALWICVKLSKVLKKTYRLTFSSISTYRNPSQIKFGLFFMASCISKFHNKMKSYSFNSILRQKARPISIENLIEVLKLILRTRYSYCFSSLKFFLIHKKNRNFIKFVLMLQAILEKSKYRQVIRGFNSFRTNFFNRTMVLEFASDRSFNARSMCKMLVTPPSESPTLELTLPMTNRNTYEASNLNTERRTSLHNFQQILVKKVADRLTNESKSSLINKTNNLIGKAKQNGHDKRMAYNESLKERQKKKIALKIHKEPSVSSTNISRKPSMTSPITKQHSKSYVFDQIAMKATKYRIGIISLDKILSKIVIIRMRIPFNKIRFYTKTVGNKPKKNFSSKPILRSTCNIFQIKDKRRLSIETGKNCVKQMNQIKVGENMYDSPIESPIPKRGDNNFTVLNSIPPPTPSMDLTTSHLKLLQSSPSTWKVKLYSLGLNKLKRTCKSIVGKMIFEVMKGGARKKVN